MDESVCMDTSSDIALLEGQPQIDYSTKATFSAVVRIVLLRKVKNFSILEQMVGSGSELP